MPSLPVGVVPRFVNGYDGDYVGWNNGTVTSLKRKTPRNLSPGKYQDGYSHVGLCHHGEQKTTAIHRLVAEHFIPNIDNKPEVDHRDQNNTNNDVKNLRWVTSVENSQNQGIKCNNTTGVIGVSLKPNGMFQTAIAANGHKYNKTFKTKPEAATWYAKMKAAFHIAA